MVGAARRPFRGPRFWRWRIPRPLALAALGGVAFALTAPPTNLYPAVIVGLALLAASLGDGDAAWPRSPTFGRAFARGAVWGTSAGLVGLRFVPTVIQRFTELGLPVALLALVLLAAAQSLIWAIGAGVAAVLHRRARVPFEVAFGAGVLVALSLPSIFLWSPAGLVSPWPAFVQLADLIGERGVSVLFAVAAASLARVSYAVLRREARAARTPALVAAAILGLLPIYGVLRMGAVARAAAALPTLRVGLVDPAVPPLDRWNATNHPRIVRTLRQLTNQVEGQGVDVTVWPEAAYPYPIAHEARTLPGGWRAVLGRDVHGPLLIGLITLPPPVRLPDHVEQNSYNSATLVGRDGSIQPPVDKLQLLWFGETVPGGAYLPWLRRLFERSGGLLPGEAPRALVLSASPSGALGASGVTLAVLNCYEDTLPDLGRRLDTSLGPQVLVNITNDAWFFDTAEPELHARLSAMRAVELRLDLVRAVNMGVMSWIDAAGVVRASYQAKDAGTLVATPAVRAPDLTFYARWGDAPLYGALAFVVVIFATRSRARLDS